MPRPRKPGLAGAVIVVAGEALIDVVRDGAAEQRSLGGGPFNTARTLARLGVPTTFLGHLSQDSDGRLLAAALLEDGVSLDLVSVGPHPTTLAFAQLDRTGRASYRFVLDGTAAAGLTPAMVPDSLGPTVKALHVGSLGLAVEPIAGTLEALVSDQAGRRLVMLDANIRPGAARAAGGYRRRLESVMARSTVVQVSEADLEWLYPGTGAEAGLQRLLDLGARLAVLTRGERGAMGLSGSASVEVPAPAVPVVDTIGAGDAFGAGLLAWLDEHGLISADLKLSEAELNAALTFACRIGSLICTGGGAQPLTAESLAHERARRSKASKA